MVGQLGVATQRSVAKPISGALPEGFAGAGYGRLVELEQPVSLASIVQAYASKLGHMRHVMVARPMGPAASTKQAMIKTVGVCAGSGYDVLKDTAADLIVTGEMSHHNALRLTMLGKCVLTVFHSNSERQFLRDVLKPTLESALRKSEPAAEVFVSDEDKDPFEIWDVEKGEPSG